MKASRVMIDWSDGVCNVRKCVLVLVLFLSAVRAEAEPSLPEWQASTIIKFLNLQTKPQCFPGSSRAESVHILGVTGESLKIEKADQIEILNQLSQLFSSQSSARVTNADSFRFIATSVVDFGEEKVRELQALINGASDADITVLLRPYREVGRTIDTQIILWARGAGNDGKREIQCTPSFSVRIPIANVDPRCAGAYHLAVEQNSLDRLQSFVAFFPDCPQTLEAAGRITELQLAEKGLQCERSLAVAQAKNSAAALTDYIESTDCPGQKTVAILRDRLLDNERCDSNFIAAKRANTTISLERFIIENGDCRPQIENAHIHIQLIKMQDSKSNLSQANVDPVPTIIPQPPVPEPFVSPSFDCRKSTRPTEFAICGNSDLATLDNELNRTYLNARRWIGPNERNQLTNQQRAWLKELYTCGSEAGCIAQLMRDRINQLSR